MFAFFDLGAFNGALRQETRVLKSNAGIPLIAPDLT
jgi:hypothetical protein